MEAEAEDGELTISVEDHKDRCRFCWEKIGGGDIFYKINEKTKLNFETLTSLPLSIDDDQFSLIACCECFKNLKTFSVFRDDLIRKQTKLCALIFGQDNINDTIVDDEPESEQNEVYEIGADVDVKQEEAELVLEEIEASENDGQYEEELMEDDGDACFSVLEDDDGNNLYEVPDYSLSQSPSNTSENRVRKRVQAWCWLNKMLVDLVRYQRRYSVRKKSDTAMYEKISLKFKRKNYPPISAKSLKHKFMQLRKDREKFRNLQVEAQECADSDDESIDSSVDNERTRCKGKQAAKSNTSWNESMEVLLLYFMQKFQRQQPGISYNDLTKSVTMAMSLEGHNVSDCVVRYRFKKINQDTTGRLAKLMLKVREREKELHLLGDNEEKSSIVDLNLPKVGRNLHWSDEMIIALINHRDDAKSQAKKGELWRIVAERMKSDGFGIFAAPKLMFKYSNLMRESKWKNYSSSAES